MGLKRTSELLQIGGSVTQQEKNQAIEVEVSLPLSTLDREVFVITDLIMDVDFPQISSGTNTRVFSQVTKTSCDDGSGNIEFKAINDADLVGRIDERVLYPSANAMAYVRTSSYDNYMHTTGTKLDHLGILATPNFYIAIDSVGTSAASVKGGYVRLHGYRAKADADTYAALVTAELYE
tara:strand:+ start:314 stop:850 length:537 start_codon:yes stop_codon:yes gene_type:complete